LVFSTAVKLKNLLSITEKPLAKPTITIAMNPPKIVRPSTPSPSRPGMITSSVTRPKTIVKPTTTKEKRFPAEIPMMCGIGWAFIERKTNLNQRFATPFSLESSPTFMVVRSDSESVNNCLCEF